MKRGKDYVFIKKMYMHVCFICYHAEFGCHVTRLNQGEREEPGDEVAAMVAFAVSFHSVKKNLSIYSSHSVVSTVKT